ncbi:hypothetical protein NLC26_02270 [Candidatus Aminicenantes bacterium AC-708-M15]|jgi:predicted anti-sigma-YlaC factor YlaD|nr:hypothetical protein [SCandidatus Aminicenantes bacterium Aminicenantia_JdfR_composite]MCP2596880.1 hypothetical protein [Candidatus Aminicenantes bacterium AC-335-G13]MCP2598499.1 hypothetical protein [Candidatus Aminicenantes bacterium AC-335-L06]MCP2599087.1 hypothetical protein [Candidatus Aminicenantes bacterium AC-335-B20]MCP2604287.1 hypothetical protein [Candidatus Aminicenantes bacterium AC-708-M15]MCP2605825.1 hypothetical protein [Candidatus Aminicenantes bacterium AC-335-O07]MC
MCKIYKLVYSLIPVKKVKSLLIEKHFGNCPKCHDPNEIESYMKNILLAPEKIEIKQSVWPLVKQRITQQERLISRKKWKLKWQWAFAISLIFVVIIISISYISGLFLKKTSKYNQKITSPLEIKLKVESAKIKNKPANIYIFQGKNHKMTIIWVEPYKNTGG